MTHFHTEEVSTYKGTRLQQTTGNWHDIRPKLRANYSFTTKRHLVRNWSIVYASKKNCWIIWRHTALSLSTRVIRSSMWAQSNDFISKFFDNSKPLLAVFTFSLLAAANVEIDWFWRLEVNNFSLLAETPESRSFLVKATVWDIIKSAAATARRVGSTNPSRKVLHKNGSTLRIVCYFRSSILENHILNKFHINRLPLLETPILELSKTSHILNKTNLQRPFFFNWK